MANNSFGEILRLTTFGESHNASMGGVLDGVPAGVSINIEHIQNDLDRRRPGQSEFTTARSEADKVEILSGLHFDKDDNGCQLTLGSPIGFIIRNLDKKSSDYDALNDIYRPSHADYTYQSKYGIRDHRGGGRSSARETVCRVVGGAIAKQLLGKEVVIQAYVEKMGGVAIPQNAEYDISNSKNSPVLCPHPETSKVMEAKLKETASKGDTVGGVISCRIKGVPAGWGEPVFDKINARLAFGIMGINATKGIEFGSGFSGADRMGSEENDQFESLEKTTTNNSGGIQGGISNGQEILFRTAFKPVSSIKIKQNSMNNKGELVEFKIDGRHDPSVLPRAVPIIEAMTALILADFFLRQKTQLMK
jgi:chorismate synthase